MIALLTDEDVDGRIIRGALRKYPTLDLVRAQDVGLSGQGDPTVLDWAARAGRVVVTHDGATMPRHAYARVGDGLPMPGVLHVARSMPIGQAIEEIMLVAECYSPDECEDQVVFLPL